MTTSTVGCSVTSFSSCLTRICGSCCCPCAHCMWMMRTQSSGVMPRSSRVCRSARWHSSILMTNGGRFKYCWIATWSAVLPRDITALTFAFALSNKFMWSTLPPASRTWKRGVRLPGPASTKFTSAFWLRSCRACCKLSAVSASMKAAFICGLQTDTEGTGCTGASGAIGSGCGSGDEAGGCWCGCEVGGCWCDGCDICGRCGAPSTGSA
mmetsp:Transcript_13618/g.37488  ORF Transcript_13618/g.37488 Transcript_13618/m.37488 type:complete len:210 (-) Transcript_13618:1226-1855(-)